MPADNPVISILVMVTEEFAAGLTAGCTVELFGAYFTLVQEPEDSRAGTILRLRFQALQEH